MPLRNDSVLRSALSVLLLALPLGAGATTISASDTDGDAALTLTLDSVITEGRTGPWGSVRIQVGSSNVSFTAGDSIEISVLEDDLVGDDLAFQTSFTITTGELAAGAVDRRFSVSFDPADVADPTDMIELYAEATVIKAACTSFCRFDNPRTANLDVRVEPIPEPTTGLLVLAGLLTLGRRPQRARGARE